MHTPERDIGRQGNPLAAFLSSAVCNNGRRQFFNLLYQFSRRPLHSRALVSRVRCIIDILLYPFVLNRARRENVDESPRANVECRDYDEKKAAFS